MASGGKRAGAGRPAGAKNKKPAEGRKTIFKSLTIAGSPGDIEEIKRLADEAGMSVSKYIIQTVLKK